MNLAYAMLMNLRVVTARKLHLQSSRAWFARPTASGLPQLQHHSFQIRSCAAQAAPAEAADAPQAQLQDILPTHCCGCGVRLQSDDKNKQGFYVVPQRVKDAFESGAFADPVAVAHGIEDDAEEALEHEDVDERIVMSVLDHAGIKDPDMQDAQRRSARHDRASSNSEASSSYDSDDEIDLVLRKMQDKAFASLRKPRINEVREREQAEADELEKLLQLTCVRCHKLTFEGKVASITAELQLPPFDLNLAVGTKIKRRTARRAVLLVVVDVADFDGSLPRAAVKALLPKDWDRETRDRLPFELILAVNKIDALPRSASYSRIENALRRRMNQAGLPTPSQVHLVSSIKYVGIPKLATQLVERVGIMGDLWVVGAQNAGKSSLINALKQNAGTAKATAPLTTAPLPGTTLSLTPVQGLPLMSRSRCYDTPGVPHPYQYTSRLPGEDVKVLLARQRAMIPRTYRLAEGNTLFLGGLARVDIVKLPSRTAYFTVWASDLLPLHAGKTETADEFYERFVGDKLFPPSAGSRGDEAATAPGVTQGLGELEPLQVTVQGEAWTRSSTDVCVAGLGWLGVGVDGVAELRVWRHEGIAITTREALLPNYAEDFESPGWSRNTKTLFKNWSGMQKGKPSRPEKGGRGTRGAAQGRSGNSSAGARGRGRGGDGSGGRGNGAGGRGGRSGGRGAEARGSRGGGQTGRVGSGADRRQAARP